MSGIDSEHWTIAMGMDHILAGNGGDPLVITVYGLRLFSGLAAKEREREVRRDRLRHPQSQIISTTSHHVQKSLRIGNRHSGRRGIMRPGETESRMRSIKPPRW